MLIGNNCCVFVILNKSELHHSIGSLIDGAHPGPKTDGDYLGRYCPKTFETERKIKKSTLLLLLQKLNFSFFPFAVSKVFER